MLLDQEQEFKGYRFKTSQSGRIDHFWRDAFMEIEKELSAPPAELKRLVKISDSLPPLLSLVSPPPRML